MEIKKPSLNSNGEYKVNVVFSPEVLKLDGKMVKIRGYIIAYDYPAYLSAFPDKKSIFSWPGPEDNSVGMESAVELWLMDGKYNFRYDQRVTMKGMLNLGLDSLEPGYYLEDAKPASFWVRFWAKRRRG